MGYDKTKYDELSKQHAENHEEHEDKHDRNEEIFNVLHDQHMSLQDEYENLQKNNAALEKKYEVKSGLGFFVQNTSIFNPVHVMESFTMFQALQIHSINISENINIKKQNL